MGQLSSSHGTGADLRSVAILGDKGSYALPGSPTAILSIQTPSLVKSQSSEMDALVMVMSMKRGANSSNLLSSSPPLSTNSGVNPLVTSPLTIYSTTPSLTEGLSNSSILVATFNDSDSNQFSTQYSAMIDWGDGQSSAGTVSGGAAPAAPTRSSVTQVGLFQVNGSHTYAEEGTYTITVTINDADGATGTGASTANVADAALTSTPTPLIDAAPGVAVTGIVGNFKDADPAGTVTDYTATITWGDNHTSPGTIAANGQGGFQVT